SRYHSDKEIIDIVYRDGFSKISIYSFIKNNIFKAKYDIPNIEKINVKYKSPWHVVLQVYEKPIIGYARYLNEYYYFDEDLYILEKKSEKENKYMEISGINMSRNNIHTYLYIDNKNAPYIIKAVSRYKKDIGMQIENINFAKSNEIVIEGEGLYVNIGNGDNIEEKMSLLIDIYPKIEGLNGSLDLSKVKTRYDKGEYIFKKAIK
ncbi:MAG: hypothetical protein MJ151_01720, partial [Lachnospiraceae bacterium]|nr:hypothetical protein [Lachnospiraceae bacterium]